MGSLEARSISLFGLLLLGLAVLFFFFPEVLVYPEIALLAWMALALLYKGSLLYWRHKREQKTSH